MTCECCNYEGYLGKCDRCKKWLCGSCAYKIEVHSCRKWARAHFICIPRREDYLWYFSEDSEKYGEILKDLTEKIAACKVLGINIDTRDNP